VETSFHSGIFDVIEDSGPEIIRAIKDAAPAGLEVRVIMGMSHNAHERNGKRILREFHQWEELDGIDLHGPEYWPVEDWTADVWERARRADKLTKAHAGEFMGADFVSRMLDELKVSRIEHGVRSIEDVAVVDRLVRERIPLDVCPISNVKLAVKGVSSMSAHPIRQLFDAGVIVTLSSDDPLMFGNSLSEEYYALYQDLHFSKHELIQIARNGFEVALWDEREKKPYLDELERIEIALG
jgi:adenosine deaminase